MKNSSNRILGAMLFAFAAITSQAQTTWTIDGVRYRTNTFEDADKTAAVIAKTDNQSDYYSGSITIQSSVEGHTVDEIADGAFRDCKFLDKVSLPGTITRIRNNAFQKSSLAEIILPSSLTELGYNAFYESSLTSVTVPQSLSTIGNTVFYHSINLASVTLEPGLTRLGDGMFKECTALKTIQIPGSVIQTGDNTFKDCTALTSATIGSGVTRLGEYMFDNCTSLCDVTLGENLDTLGMNAFHACKSLATITLPASVTRLESFVFYSCLNLASVTCYAVVPPTTSDYAPFSSEIYSTAILYVPAESIEAYATAPTWKNFKHIMPIVEVHPSLTIKDAEQGASVIMLSNKSTRLTVLFQPEEGWEVSSVLYDDNDVTDQLVANAYTTPVIDHAAVLTVVYKQSSGMAQAPVADTGAKVYVSPSGLVVSGAKAGSTIQAFDVDGHLLQTIQATGWDTLLSASDEGIVIVRVEGGETFKVKL